VTRRCAAAEPGLVSPDLGLIPPEADADTTLTCACGAFWSGRWDLNPRSPAPKAGALTKLRHVPCVPPDLRRCYYGVVVGEHSGHSRICFDLCACPPEPQERRWQRPA
jgi:hypothetical protein